MVLRRGDSMPTASVGMAPGKDGLVVSPRSRVGLLV